jgi:FMN-dependent oxidoreductase (nitrilotriacetate monooxygenase family)
MFHLGWFLGNGFGIQDWNVAAGHGPWTGTNVRDWMHPDFYVDLASSLERAGFDYILIEDTSMIEDTFGSSAEVTLRRGFLAPKNDPMPLVPLITARTSHIGVIPTFSTIQYPPYLAARLATTLDHLTEGRIGMNVVTSVTDRVAQNFGYEEHLEHDERYAMATEWIDVVRGLQGTWDSDAIIADPQRGVYADHTKVRPLDHVGRFFRSRGPLNTIPGPQRTPPIASAGTSEAGRDLAARYDDTMLAAFTSVEAMKAFRADMSERLISYGRKPSDLKILFLCMPTVGASDEEAIARKEAKIAHARSDAGVEWNLWNMSYVSGGRIDFGGFDLDVPVEEIDLSKGNGEFSSLANLFENSGGRSLREIARARFQITDLGLVGSPDTVASRMEEIMDEVGGDGFLLYGASTRLGVAEIADGLAPALRRRGAIRDGYSGARLIDHLQEF